MQTVPGGPDSIFEKLGGQARRDYQSAFAFLQVCGLISLGSFPVSCCSFVASSVAGSVAGLLEVLLAWETRWSALGSRG